jgi:hypothetical protein
MLPLNGIQIDDTGRKVVFPNIKNKFRFVTVSFLLAIMATAISSASAAPDPDDLSFDLSISACANSAADWAPAFREYQINESAVQEWYGLTPILAQQGDRVTIFTNLNWTLGSDDCGATLAVNQTGTFSAEFVGLDGTYFPTSTTMSPASDTEVSNYFDIPDNAAITNGEINLVEATYRLTWTP